MPNSAAGVNDLIQHIFQVSLTPHTTKFFLQELSSELKREGMSSLSLSHLDRIIMERLSPNSTCQPLLYLYHCFERSTIATKENTLLEIDNLILRYGSLVLQHPQLFNGMSIDPNVAMQLPLMATFIDNILRAITDEGDKNEVFILIIKDWIIPGFSALEDTFSGDRASGLFEFTSKLVNSVHRPLLFSSFIHPECSAIDGKNVYLLEQRNFFFATILSRGPLNGNPTKHTSTNAPDSLEYKNYISSLHLFIKGLLSDQHHRSIVVSYFRDVLLANHNKSKLQYNIRVVSSFAFLINICSLWLLFSLPFASQGQQKVSIIVNA